MSAQLDMLAPCRVPARGTQCYDLLMAMQQGVRLTIWNAMQDYRCGALHQRIRDLRGMGWPVMDALKEGTNVKEFWLAPRG